MNVPNPDSTETRNLLDAVRHGHSETFDKLFRRHRKFLGQVVAARIDPRVAPRIDPSDVIQETHLEAFRRLADFLRRKPMSFRLWLRKMACERLLILEREHLRAQRRSVDREVQLSHWSMSRLAASLAGTGSEPSRRMTRQERARAVHEAVAELAAADREILLMRNAEALTNQEVAQLLGIEAGAASQRYGRALLRLRKLLAKRGVEGRDD